MNRTGVRLGMGIFGESGAKDSDARPNGLSRGQWPVGPIEHTPDPRTGDHNPGTPEASQPESHPQDRGDEGRGVLTDSGVPAQDADRSGGITGLVSQLSLGLDASRFERDTQYAIAFVNPHIRRIMRSYVDDPFWSQQSLSIIRACISDSESYLDPRAVLSGVDGLSSGERERLVQLGERYNEVKTPADAAVVARTITFRLKTFRLHSFIREYDNSKKTEKDVELFISNVSYVSRHYGLSMPVEDFSSIDIDAIVPEEEDSLVVIPSFFAPLNSTFGYGGYLAGRLVTVAGAPARGKTTFLLNELVNFALLGKRVLYFSFADQDKFDLILKIVSIVSGYRLLKTMSESSGPGSAREIIEQYYTLVSNPDLVSAAGGSSYSNPLFDLAPSAIHSRGLRTYLLRDDLVKSVISRISLVVETENRPYIQDIQSTVMAMEEEPDVIIVDYDRYIKARTEEGLYQEGEEIYDGLVSIAKPKIGKKKLVLVASQINKAYWSLPDPPLQSLADSSRKQGIADMVITIGRAIDRVVHEGYITLAKNRIGPTGKFPYLLLPTTNIVPWRELSSPSSSSEGPRRKRSRQEDREE